MMGRSQDREKTERIQLKPIVRQFTKEECITYMCYPVENAP